jgi:Zn-finger nucleic acid-binding protein
MHCPVDGTILVLSSRRDVEIDYCPQCRGVWLDRGELDKVVARDEREHAPTRQPTRKKKGWLSEMFEAD